MLLRLSLRKLSITLVVAISALAWLITYAGASEPEFPHLTGRVVDAAGVLSPRTLHRIDTMLAEHERATGDQIVVATVKSLQGYGIEDYGYRLGRYWGIGSKEKNNGAVLLVAPNERKVRIEVGYGLEGRLTDAQCTWIIQQDILPFFKTNRLSEGVLNGVIAILRTLEEGRHTALNEAVADSEPPGWLELLALLLAVSFVIAAVLRHGSGPPRSAGTFGWFPGTGMWTQDSGETLESGGFFAGGGGSFGGGGATGSW